MFRITYKLAAGIFALFLLFSCSSNTEQNTTAHKDNTAKIPSESFWTMFPKVNLPFALPIAEPNAESKELDKNVIENFFANSSYTPAFGKDKDVPDLADNAESAHYFSEGIFQTDGYTAVIIRKTDEDTYYYLSTFTPDGKFIQGMCVAFAVGADAERIASINDDYSIQIRQTDKTAENAATATQNTFYEISSDGHIQSLNNTPPTVPA